MSDRQHIIVGITGASGACYAKRLVQCLCSAGVHVHLVVSTWGKRLLADELGISEISAAAFLGSDAAADSVTVHPNNAMGCVLSSGSFSTQGMIICPTSSNTLGLVAGGIGDSLLTRAASVTLKERRRLVLVTREMPTSQIDLHNMLRISQAGGIICPACPGFYMNPECIGDIVDFVVGKLLDLMDVPHDLNTRWLGERTKSR
jgi:flavin prenyltransferase